MIEPISAAAAETAKTASATKKALTESLKEAAETTAKETPVQSMMETVENSSLETLKAQNEISRESVTEQELKRTEDAYNDEIREKAAAGEVNPTDVSKWKEVSAEECKAKRYEFKCNKNKIITDWEKKNGQEWPRYKEDVYSEKGKLLAKEGDKYDAHHIQPLKHGGENTAENITPIHKKDHDKVNGIHRANSPYAKLVDHFKVS